MIGAFPAVTAASVSVLCGLEREALTHCVAHNANPQCSSCLAGSELLLYPVVDDDADADDAGTSSTYHGWSSSSCDALRSQICLNLETQWSSCTACEGFCEAELEDFYQCSVEALAEGTLNCDEEALCCFGACDKAPTEPSRNQHHRKLQVGFLSNFFAWLRDLIFGSVGPPSDDGPNDRCSCPAEHDVDDNSYSDGSACITEEDNLNTCLQNSGTGCYNCIKLLWQGLFPAEAVSNSPTCSDANGQTCSKIETPWRFDCPCEDICTREADCYYGCRIKVLKPNCGNDLNCVCEEIDRFVCYSPYNTIEVKDKGTIFMDQIQIGDLVSINGKDEYSRVYSFGHLDSKSTANYLQIFAEGLQQPLEISPNHLLYANSKLTPASQIKKGDFLNSNGISIKVTEIESIQRQGIYAPLTESGTLRVSGVEVSNYVALSTFLPRNVVPLSEYLPYSVHHAISHGWTAPLRWACALNFEICKSETYKNGYASWVYANLQFSSKVGEIPKLVQIVLALLVAPFPVALYSPLLMVIAVFLFSICWFKNTAIIIKTKSKSC